GVFPYSFEPGTPATRLDGHLPEEVKLQRRDRLMAAQQEIAFGWSKGQVGKELEVLIDGPDPEVPNHSLARSHADAPDIDCTVRAEWKMTRDERGKSLVALTLSDWTSSVTGCFAPDELKNAAKLEGRLSHLWGDLLQDRSHKQLKKLRESVSQLEDD